jgi:hypothetical protein
MVKQTLAKKRITSFKRYVSLFCKHLIPPPKQAAELFVYYVAGTLSTALALIFYSILTGKLVNLSIF